MKKTTKIFLAGYAIAILAVMGLYAGLGAERTPRSNDIDFTDHGKLTTVQLPAFEHLVVEIPGLHALPLEELQTHAATSDRLVICPPSLAGNFVNDTLLAADQLSRLPEAGTLLILQTLKPLLQQRLAGDTLIVRLDVPVDTTKCPLFRHPHGDMFYYQRGGIVKLGPCIFIMEKSPVSVSCLTLHEEVVHSGYKVDSLHLEPGLAAATLIADTLEAFECAGFRAPMSFSDTRIERLRYEVPRGREDYGLHYSIPDSATARIGTEFVTTTCINPSQRVVWIHKDTTPKEKPQSPSHR